MSRQTTIALLMAAFIGLAYLLYSNVHESHLFNITEQVAKTQKPPKGHKALPTVSGTTLASLTTVSTSNQLENPRYTGQDATNHTWEVTARRAHQEGTTASGTIVLETVQALWQNPPKSAKGEEDTPTSPTTISLNANQGQYNKESNLLIMQGDVHLFGMGLLLVAPRIAAHMDTHAAEATGGTTLTGQVGGWSTHVTAPTLTVTQDDEHLALSGGVHAVLTPLSASTKAAKEERP